jgi:hypothetical protein
MEGAVEVGLRVAPAVDAPVWIAPSLLVKHILANKERVSQPRWLTEQLRASLAIILNETGYSLIRPSYIKLNSSLTGER